MDAIPVCRIVVLVFSANSNDSPYCISEIRTAFDLKKEIIPILIDNTLPHGRIALYLGSKQWFYANTPPLEPHLKKLADEVKRHLSQLKAREEATAREKAWREAEPARKAKEAEENAREEAEKAAKEKKRQEAEIAEASRKAEEAKKAKEAALKAKQEAEEAIKEKERYEAEGARARKEAEEARKARKAALEARQKADKIAQERERREVEKARLTLEKKKPGKSKAAWIWAIIGVAVVVIAGTVLFLRFGPGSGPGTGDTTNGTDAVITTTNITTTTTTQPPSLPPGEYVRIDYTPTIFDKSEVTGNETFNANLSGNFTCLKDITYPVSGLSIVPKITARNTSTGGEVTLIVSKNITAEPIPLKQGETAGFEQILQLQFPDQAATGNYILYLNAESIKVNISGLWAEIADLFQLKEQLLGTVKYNKEKIVFNYVEGYVRDAATNAPIADALVDVIEPATTSTNFTYYTIYATGYSDSAGYYKTEPFSGNGTYIVRVTAGGYPNQWYQNASAQAQATLITFKPGGETLNINFSLHHLGSISGKITADADGNSIAAVTVIASDYAAGTQVASTQTLSDGTYTLTGVPAGTYKIRAMPSTNKLTYADEYYNNTYDSARAQPVTVTLGQNISGINFSLARSGSISGKVIADDTLDSIANLHVYVSEYPSGMWIAGTYTNSDGTYTLLGLPPGDYRVSAAPSNNKLPYVDEFYNNSYDYWNIQIVAVATGQDVSGINFSLATGGSISGTVRNADGSKPLANFFVECQRIVDGKWEGWGTGTNSLGKYTFYGIPYGQFSVRARDANGNGNYVMEYYNEVSRQASSTLVTVSKDINPTNIDFTLELGGSLSGKIISDTTFEAIAYVHVDVMDYNTSEWLGCADTGADGTFTVYGLPTGSYRVLANTSLNKLPYIDEYYLNTINSSSAKPVSVTKGQDTPNINFSLASSS
jgi:hypothetical protein